MATDIDEKLLDEILTDLEKARSWTPRTIAKLESLIHSEDEFALFRINPIRFADEKKVSEAEAIDLFLMQPGWACFRWTGNCFAPYAGPSLTVSIASTMYVRIIFAPYVSAAQRLPWTTTCR